MITIGLADDEPLFTAGLAMILDAQPDMRVIWQAIDGADAIRAPHLDTAHDGSFSTGGGDKRGNRAARDNHTRRQCNGRHGVQEV